MSELERLQKLHHRAATGETLLPEEQATLEKWYETLEREEDAEISRQNQNIDVVALREKLEKTTAQITVVSREVEALIERNEILRDENHDLRERFEARLVERAA